MITQPAQRSLRRPPALILLLILAYVAGAWFFPSHLHGLWLGIAVVVAARAWEETGGVVMGVFAAAAACLGLWRVEGPEAFREPVLLAGYGWAVLALIAMGLYVGSLTRQTRQMARMNADLLQAQQQLAALHQIALSLSTTLDAQRLMEIILEQLGRLWGYDYGAILVVDEATGDLVLSAAQGYAAKLGLRLRPGEGICGAALQSGKPVCVGDVTKDPRYVEGVEGARSQLAVPLAWEGQTLGVLSVESREVNAFGEKDVALLTTVAEQAAAYLANARLHQRTQMMAITDGHTGLYNYRHYLDQVTSHVRHGQLTGSSFALLMLDLDHFKRCNDTYGHPTGDHVLVQVASVLRASCRHDDLVFRYGGEEFAVIMPGTDKKAAYRVAERIRDRISTHVFVTKENRPLDFGLTVSIGIAGYPDDGITEVDLILAADQALYAAKQCGRNCIVVYHPGEPAVHDTGPAAEEPVPEKQPQERPL